MVRILIANDDGIYGLGLKALIKAIRLLGEVIVVVPDSERSAASHSITLHKPFRVQTFPIELNKKEIVRIYATNGTPSDCVRFGVLRILKGKKVDLVIGGINHGLNLGEDTIYSGTVAVSREAAMLGIPGFSVSVPHHAKREVFECAAQICARLAKIILKNKLPPKIFLNVNVPLLRNSHIPLQVTRLGKRVYGREISSGVDPRGQQFYWLAGAVPKGIPESGTDIAAIKAGKVSITPLTIDSTSQPFMSDLAEKLRKENGLGHKSKKLTAC